LPLISQLSLLNSHNIELPIRETARHQADRAVCGHAGISELSLPHRIARYASLSYKSVGENMRYAFGNSFSMLSGFFSLTARQSKHNRSASQANASNMAFPLFSLALQCGRRWKILAFTFHENSDKYASIPDERNKLFLLMFKNIMNALYQ